MFRRFISKLVGNPSKDGQIPGTSSSLIDQSALADFVRQLREVDTEDTVDDATDDEGTHPVSSA